MSRDGEFPSNWDDMNDAERTQWLTKWFDMNVDLHQRIGKMQRKKAKAAWENYRNKNGRGKRRK